jgi:hypothetical protein
VLTSSKTVTSRWFLPALFLAFLFRLAYGLCSEIWFIDQRQIYLIGLKFYTTGLWPYFGPDVSSHIQLPGALQGLSVGIPLYLFPIPESPFLFLNILSFAGLCLFAWVCSKRLPAFPSWIIWAWLLTAPWVLNWSTNIDNDSYVLFGSSIFFTGFLEAAPNFRRGFISIFTANFLMGFGLFWNAQFHMSYVILFPFAFTALGLQILNNKKGRMGKILPAFYFLLGSLVTGIFILPTLLQYGFAAGGSANAVAFNPENFGSFFTVLARFLSLASCEILRFIGADTADRLAFLNKNPWLYPFAAVAILLGWAQALFLLASWVRKDHPQTDWTLIRILAGATFLLIYLSFLFAIKAPAAHTYYLTLPVAMLYGFYCFLPLVSKPWFIRAAQVLLACNLVFHAGLALNNITQKSIYKDRELFVRAIQEKNYHLLGERRANTLY